ncbi:hypothetical protein GPA10_22465 [Streptomyces sp. p1417]|uniref:Uncharacterized protein n=1 Tax=Streptomyces typhae TaxID=2681492 RepID=A0A6L6X195_9ACTN|nr:hypothetical protein [Streptomyces typhae]MVO87450.1 hypothetical protein [Streptomyces typhae]
MSDQDQGPEWDDSVGYPQLGRPGTPTYRGYVVQVQGTDDGHPEKWFTYTYERANQKHVWVGEGSNVDEAKAVLERHVSAPLDELAGPTWVQESDSDWRLVKPNGKSLGVIRSEWDSGWEDGQWVFAGEQHAATYFYAYETVSEGLLTYIDRYLSLEEAKKAVEDAR